MIAVSEQNTIIIGRKNIYEKINGKIVDIGLAKHNILDYIRMRNEWDE